MIELWIIRGILGTILITGLLALWALGMIEEEEQEHKAYVKRRLEQ